MSRSLKSWLSRAAVVIIALAAAACGGGGDGATPTGTPAQSATPPRPDDGTVTPTPPPPETAYRLVYREFGAQQDIIWRVSPQDLTNREQLAVIGHSDSCGIRASLSPDGRLLAYVVQPPGTPCEPDNSRAEAHVIDLLRQEDEKITDGIDLRFTPLWSPEGQLLYLRRYSGNEFLNADVFVLQVRITRKPAPGERTAEPTPEPTPPTPVPEDPVRVVLQDKVSTVLSFIPIGFADDGKTMYFIQVQGGTTVATLAGRYAPATAEAIAAATAEAEATATALGPDATIVPPLTPTPLASFVVKLSDQVVRDPALSPDGKRLSFTAQELADGEIVDRTFVADLARKSVVPLVADGLPAYHISPLWHPDGQRLAVGTLPSGGRSGAVALVPLAGGPPSYLPEPTMGFDVPQSWSPDGRFLAVRSLTGQSLVNPGSARMELVAPSGQRMTIAEGADVLAVGWWKPEE